MADFQHKVCKNLHNFSLCRELPFDEMQALFSGHDPEGQILVASEKMAILADQVIGAYPLGVGCNESVCWFEPHLFIFGSKLEWNHKILVDFCKAPNQCVDLTEDVSRKIPVDFIDDQARDTDRMSFRMANEGIK